MDPPRADCCSGPNEATKHVARAAYELLSSAGDVDPAHAPGSLLLQRVDDYRNGIQALIAELLAHGDGKAAQHAPYAPCVAAAAVTGTLNQPGSQTPSQGTHPLLPTPPPAARDGAVAHAGQQHAAPGRSTDPDAAALQTGAAPHPPPRHGSTPISSSPSCTPTTTANDITFPSASANASGAATTNASSSDMEDDPSAAAAAGATPAASQVAAAAAAAAAAGATAAASHVAAPPPPPADLDPSEWQVPPHCIPIHANVTTFDWPSLAAACQFDVIMMDPPWQLATANPTRGVALGYSQLSDDAIAVLPVTALQRDGGLLFVWVINAKYKFTLDLFDKWGYE